MSNFTNISDFIDGLTAGNLTVALKSGANSIDNFFSDSDNFRSLNREETENLTIPEPPRNKKEKAEYVENINEADKILRGAITDDLLTNLSEEDKKDLQEAFEDYLDSLIEKTKEKIKSELSELKTGHKAAIKNVLKDLYGYSDDNDKFTIDIIDEKTINPQMVKARFRIYENYKVSNKELIVDLITSVWGEIICFNVFGKIEDAKKPFLFSFLDNFKDQVKRDIRISLDQYKKSLKMDLSLKVA